LRLTGLSAGVRLLEGDTGVAMPIPLESGVESIIIRKGMAMKVAEEMARNGEPSVAKLTKGFADAVTAAHRPPDTTH
jgi:hypothetical protein